MVKEDELRPVELIHSLRPLVSTWRVERREPDSLGLDLLETRFGLTHRRMSAVEARM